LWVRFWLRDPVGVPRSAPGSAREDYTLTRPGPHTWRHTATSRPCTVTWSAGTTIGA
jgi:hypothetical protein